MRLFGRHDLVPAAGLAVALVVVFSAPVARLLDTVRAVEDARGLQLLPALVILAFVFMAHQLWKRQELRARTAASDAAAREATARAADMSRLVRLGQELAQSLEPEAIRKVAVDGLPHLVPGRRIWLMRADGARELLPSSLAGDGAHPPSSCTETGPPSTSAFSPRLAAGSPVAPTAAVPGDICFPMLVADEELGLLGVDADPPLSEHQRNMLAAAAALLAVSLKNAALLENVRQTSVRDALTGCVNRAHALEVLDAELRRSRRSGAAVSVVMFDLDHFKSINDTLGHLCGDAVLASVGERLRAVLRGGDLKCRYGGEEFLILLTDTPAAGASRVAEMLRRDIDAHGVYWHDERIAVTASFGVATALPDETDPLALVARADEALYAAKQQGRNRVCVTSPPLHHSPAADQPHQEQHDRDDQQNPDEVAECVAADHPQ